MVNSLLTEEITMKKLVSLGFLAMALLQSVRLSASQSAVVSNAVPHVRVKAVQFGEKKVKLKAELRSDHGAIQIRREDEMDVSQTNAPLAEVAVSTVGPCGFDFAATPTGDLMWVFVQQVCTPGRGLFCLVYPLTKEQGGNYTHRMTRRSVGGKQIEVPIQLDLTSVIQDKVVASIQRGMPLALGRGARISDVQLESTNAASVVVTGKLGANYSFRGTVMLDANNDILAEDFAIEPTRQKAVSDAP
jgi:hypothetical protein